RDRDGLPGPGDGAADVDLAELLPRRGAPEARGPAELVRQRDREADRPQGAEGDGDRHPGSRPAGRDALGRRAAVGRDRTRGLLRRAAADPRRADVGARRQAGRRRAEVRRSGARPRRRRHLHLAQPAPRVPGRRPLRDPQPRPDARQLREGGHHARGADQADGRRRRARAADARAAGHRRGVTEALEVLTVGRIGVDLYAEQLGVPLERVRSFAKSIGGSPTNVAVAAARLGRRSAVLTKVGDDELGAYVYWALDDFGVDTRFVGAHRWLRTPLVVVTVE